MAESHDEAVRRVVLVASPTRERGRPRLRMALLAGRRIGALLTGQLRQQSLSHTEDAADRGESDDASNTPEPVAVTPTRSHPVPRQPPRGHRRQGGSDYGTEGHPDEICSVWCIPGGRREHNTKWNDDHPDEPDKHRRHSTSFLSTRLGCHAVSLSGLALADDGITPAIRKSVGLPV